MEPIDPRKIVSSETDDEIAYQKVTTALNQRIQQMLDEMREVR